jgi:hypothetical protein
MMKYSEALRTFVDGRLKEGYSMWEETGLPPLGADERYAAADAVGAVYGGLHSGELAAACQCFRLFRALHTRSEEFPAVATLLGDYFFSQFSLLLIPLDNVRLTEAFSDFLATGASAQVCGAADAGADDGFIDFIGATLKDALS